MLIISDFVCVFEEKISEEYHDVILTIFGVASLGMHLCLVCVRSAHTAPSLGPVALGPRYYRADYP